MSSEDISAKVTRLSRLKRRAKELQLSQLSADKINHYLQEQLQPQQVLSDLQQHLPQDSQTSYHAAVWPSSGTGSAEQDSRLIEQAFLYSPFDQWVALLHHLSENQTDFFGHIHPHVRDQILAQLWSQHFALIICLLPSAEVAASGLQRLCYLYSLIQAQKPGEAMMFFKQHRLELHKAVVKWQEYTKLTQGQFYLQLGKIALALDAFALAQELLRQVPVASDEHSQAVSLAVLAERGSYQDPQLELAAQLRRITDWWAQLDLLESQLRQLKVPHPNQQQQALALDHIIKDLLSWLPEQPEPWARASQLLMDYWQIHEVLPHALRVYEQRAYTFLQPDLEIALWQPVADLEESIEPLRNLWQAFAGLHLFISRGDFNEKTLWQAFDHYLRAQRLSATALAFTWPELLLQARKYIAKASGWSEQRRQRVLAILAITTESRYMVPHDILSYLKVTTSPAYSVLARLLHAGEELRRPDIELEVLQKMSQSHSLTNQNLSRLWSLALQQQNHALGWRAATLLAGRGVLKPVIAKSWAISGEKRDRLISPQITEATLIRALEPSKPEHKAFAYALLHIGRWIPALAAILQPGLKARKRLVSEQEQVIDECLKRFKFLKPLRQSYEFEWGYGISPLRLPVSFECLPEHSWGLLVIRIAERLGITSWGWSLAKLREYLDTAMPSYDLGRTQKVVGKKAKWLHNLPGDARTAWFDLPSIINHLNDEEAVEIQLILVLKLASLLQQNPFGSLKALYEMRAPLAIKRAYEAWLLSDTYFKLTGGVHGQTIAIPHSLQSETSALIHDVT